MKQEKKMTYLLLGHQTCSTVAKARQWLKDHQIDFSERSIVQDNPRTDELKSWVSLSGKNPGQFFNTSGLKYRALDLKNKRLTLSNEEQIKLLSTDGMLVKRPLLIGKKFVLVGFKQAEWEKTLLNQKELDE